MLVFRRNIHLRFEFVSIAFLCLLSCRDTSEGRLSRFTGLTETRSQKIARVLDQSYSRFPLKLSQDEDPMLACLKAGRIDYLVDFFARISGSRELARIVLEECARSGCPPSLAFAVAWVESNFIPSIASVNRGSVDRGLFQLNSRSYPHLQAREFFDVRLNSRNALGYLKVCLGYGGEEAIALAIYNAGLSRLAQGKVPATTYDYVEKVLTYKDDIDELFSRDFTGITQGALAHD